LRIPESDQIKEFRKFLGTYKKLTETCCLDCVKDFTTREVKPEEIIFSEHRSRKYLKTLQRISMRFQEYRIPQNEALAAKAGLLVNHGREILMDGLSVKDCQQLLLWK
ncbi:mitochondrial import inner membrane translocase subunit Tim9-like, partial [Sciurus carolinensis]|uniref:mitochondrial import inner membrane translocase subunit Tim9-like n=1 Tax=Sciurus carolinensis TaxID=30640 RepID=UPI001FB47FF5